MSNENWIDASALGSPYQQQLDTQSGRWRHRYWARHNGDPTVTIESPWKPGRAPIADILDPRDVERFSGRDD